MLGKQRQIDLDGHVLLAAEAAADQRAPHADLVVRHADGIGDGAEVLDHLGRDADVDHVVLIHPGEADLRLQEGVLLEGCLVGVLDDEVCLGEARLDIALLDLALGNDVVGAVDERRAGLQRFQRVVDARDRLKLELDQVRRPVGEIAGFGCNQRQWLAEIADPFLHQNRLIRIQPLLAGLAGDVGGRRAVGEIGGGEHAGDALERPRLRDIEAHETGARDVGAEHPHVQHVGHHVVAGIGRAARNLARRVGAGERLADLPVLDVGQRACVDVGVGHCSPPSARIAAAASAMASKILV